MKNLDEILKETDFTEDEYKTFRKVLKHYQADDLQYRLEDRLENQAMTQEEYDEAKERAYEIIERYDDNSNADWYENMDNAIEWVLGDL